MAAQEKEAGMDITEGHEENCHCVWCKQAGKGHYATPAARLPDSRQALREKIAEAFYGGTIPKEADFEAFDSYSEWDKAIKEAYKKADSILDLTEKQKEGEIAKIKAEFDTDHEQLMLVINTLEQKLENTLQKATES